MRKNKKRNSPYERMILSLSGFVEKVSTKDNPLPAELNAMTEIAKLLFKTL